MRRLDVIIQLEDEDGKGFSGTTDLYVDDAVPYANTLEEIKQAIEDMSVEEK